MSTSPASHEPNAGTWTEAIDRAGRVVTEPRRRVAALIADRDEHFTAEDIVLDARRQPTRVGRATVFRALELFEELGLIERLDLPNGRHAYVVCEQSHHHHVVCTSCGRTANIGDLGIERITDEVEARTGFGLDSHRIELYGLCASCRAALAARS